MCMSIFFRMFHKSTFCALMVMMAVHAKAQTMAQLTITPGNPTPADTIFVISTITYSGNCSYGLVYTYTATAGDTIQIMPTYCGYDFSTTCTSTDTFKIPPLASGNYIVEMEYHQGSICPISNFDAVIGHATRSLTVKNSATAFFEQKTTALDDFNFYPNPASETVTVELPVVYSRTVNIVMRNLLGVEALRKTAQAGFTTLSLEGIPSGVYVLELEALPGWISKKYLLVHYGF